jgi:sporulation protein YhbH
MTVVQDPGGFHDDGPRDARRHHDRVRRQVAERLRERIGEEKLITAGPEHRIRIPIKGSKQYRFIFDRGGGSGAGQGDAQPGDQIEPGPNDGRGEPGPAGTEPGSEEYEVWLDREEVEQMLFEQLGLPPLRSRGQTQETVAIVFDDLARRGTLLDKKETVRANMLRNAAKGEVRMGGFERDDLRYLTYREQTRPKTQAVVFMLMDVSGSMGDFEKRCARLFFWWATRFLRTRYSDVQLVFIAHHTEARECTEEEFFTRVESGGTRVSSAYDLALDLGRRRYPTTEWDWIVLEASDGDNDATDNGRVIELVSETAGSSALVGYMQIDRYQRFHWGGEQLFGVLSKLSLPNLVITRVRRDEEIWQALKEIFKPGDEAVEGAA